MPVKYGKSVVTRDRNTGKLTTQHEYMKCKSVQELIDAYNKPVVPKLRQKVKNEIVRRNKLGKTNVIFKNEEKSNELLG